MYWDFCQQKHPRKESSDLFSHLREHAGAARLDSLNLGLAVGQTAEASRKLRAVEEFTRGGADGAKRGTRLTTDAGVERSATKGAVLLSLGAVSDERVRKNAGGRSRVNARSVVDGF